MAAIKLKYIQRYQDRNGKQRYYVRIAGKPLVSLSGLPGSQEFMSAYKAALAETGAGSSEKSLEWLCGKYYAAPYFKSLGVTTQRVKRAVLEEVCALDFGGGKIGREPHKTFTQANIRKLRDAKIEFPQAANIRVKELSALYSWAAKNDLSRYNPASKIEKIKTGSKGFYTWTDKDVEAFEKRWAIGTKQRLAMSIMLYLGVRRSDAVLIGKQHESADGLSVTFSPFKGRDKTPKTLTLPIVAPLRAVLDASALGDSAWIETEHGNPYSDKSFGNTFKEWCRSAGTHADASCHGLRKIGACRAALAGASEHELMALFGWENASEARTYTRMAEQKRLAKSGSRKLHKD